MTMTREKIERMRADMQGVGDHCAWAFRVADLRPLLALAERALEPQEQALPELPKPAGWARWVDRRLEFSVGAEKPFCNERGSGYFTPWAMMFDGKTTQDYGQQCYDAGRASQLALPAGPVPALSRQQVFDKFSFLEGVVNEFYYRQIAETAIAMLAEQSPAVAQPGNTFAKFCEHCQKHGHVDAECNSTRGMNEAAVAHPVPEGPIATLHDDGCFTWKGTKPYEANFAGWKMDAYAVAQPVADEREDPIRQLIALHADEVEGNDYAYFELARHRRTDWMAWICTNVIDSDPDRKVLAQGQGDTPDEACAAAVADYRARAALCQPAEEGDKA